MRTFTTADPHGANKALVQVLERAEFDYEKDRLICLGDVCDGWSEVKETFETLLKIKKLVYVIGNHDKWFMDWIESNGSKVPHIWTSQGGIKTLESFNYHPGNVSDDIIELLFSKAVYYYVRKNKLFVHGGYNWHISIEEEIIANVTWDRHMFQTALQWQRFNEVLLTRGNPDVVLHKFPKYDEIYIGHTTTGAARYFNNKYENTDKPIFATNLIAMDTGAGYEGKLTLMNVDTKEYFQSDLVKTLYPNESGR